LRTRARRFISTLRSSGVKFAHEALPAALRILLRSFFATPFQRWRPAFFNLERGIVITIVMSSFFFMFWINLSRSYPYEQADACLLTGGHIPCYPLCAVANHGGPIRKIWRASDESALGELDEEIEWATLALDFCVRQSV
jgi:hypothetical protein